MKATKLVCGILFLVIVVGLFPLLVACGEDGEETTTTAAEATTTSVAEGEATTTN
jgi:hypothetical protein